MVLLCLQHIKPPNSPAKYPKWKSRAGRSWQETAIVAESDSRSKPSRCMRSTTCFTLVYVLLLQPCCKTLPDFEKSGAAWVLLRDEQVALSGEENLTSYIRPGKDVVSDRFCKVCAVPVCKAATEFDGVSPWVSTEDPHGHGTARVQAINVHVLKGVDMEQLKIRQLE